MSQVASEDVIHIGNGRYARFRRDRRFPLVQVTFTAPDGVDPNPGRELTEQFKELGWTWRSKDTGKPWICQLDKSSPDDPTARGDSRDTLHEQFLIIIREYRHKHGMPPIIGWQSLAESDTKQPRHVPGHLSIHTVADQSITRSEKQILPSSQKVTRAGGPAFEMLDTFASAGVQRLIGEKDGRDHRNGSNVCCIDFSFRQEVRVVHLVIWSGVVIPGAAGVRRQALRCFFVQPVHLGELSR